jgi:hypothetical protein
MKDKDSMSNSVVHDSDSNEESIDEPNKSSVAKVKQGRSAKRAKKAKNLVVLHVLDVDAWRVGNLG